MSNHIGNHMFQQKIDALARRLRSSVGSESYEEGVDALLKSIPYIREFEEAGTRPNAAPESNVLGDFLHVDSETNVRRIVDEYLATVERDDGAVARLASSNNAADTVCACGGTLQIVSTEAATVCMVCGTTRQFFEASAKNLNYNEQIELNQRRNFTYKKTSHFHETLAAAQGKTTTTVPDNIVQGILAEMKKHRVSKDELTSEQVRAFLKRLDASKYYECSRFLVNVICGDKHRYRIEQRVEDELLRMFVKVQLVFDRMQDKKRTNFLRYTYVIFKMLQLMGEERYLHLFPLLKSSAKIQAHDQLWRRVCSELGWVFIPTR